MSNWGRAGPPARGYLRCGCAVDGATSEMVTPGEHGGTAGERWGNGPPRSGSRRPSLPTTVFHHSHGGAGCVAAVPGEIRQMRAEMEGHLVGRSGTRGHSFVNSWPAVRFRPSAPGLASACSPGVFL